MKKLLAILMVLSVASVANAAVSYQVNGDAVAGETFTIDVVGDVTDMDWAEGLYTSDGTENGGLVDIIDSVCYDDPGEVLEDYLTTNAYYPSWDGVDMAAKETPSDEAGSGSGTWFTVTAQVSDSAQVGDTLTFSRQDYDDSYAELGTFSVDVVPEPATLSLLGLGGLFLARRKKNA